MGKLRVSVLSALRRWGNALRKLAPRARTPALLLPSEWSAGVYREPTLRRSLVRRAHRTLHYHLYLPHDRSHSGPLPLLVMLHGCSQDAAQFATGTRMNAVAQAYHCAVLYPEQSRAANALRCWNWFDSEAQQGLGEAGLIVGLVRDVMPRIAVDPRRVYVAGMSAGAAMAEILALRYPDVFAASASHSGVAYGAAGSASDALRAMRAGAAASSLERARQFLTARSGELHGGPAIVIHGGADSSVSPRNAEQIVALRLALAGVLSSIDQLAVPAHDHEYQSGGRTVRERDYTLGSRLLVRSLLVDGLGHAWSGGDAQLSFNDATGPDASRVILDFMMKYRLGSAVQAPRAPLAAALTG